MLRWYQRPSSVDCCVLDEECLISGNRSSICIANTAHSPETAAAVGYRLELSPALLTGTGTAWPTATMEPNTGEESHASSGGELLIPIVMPLPFLFALLF